MTLPATVTIVPDVMTRKVGDETVILHLAQGSYYGLDSVGTRIWQLLVEGKAPAEVCELMAAEYEAPPAQIEHDLRVLLDELLAQGLVALA